LVKLEPKRYNHNFLSKLKQRIIGKNRYAQFIQTHTCWNLTTDAKTLTESLMSTTFLASHEHYATFRMLNIEFNLKKVLEIGTQ
jgi:hypothetical protein